MGITQHCVTREQMRELDRCAIQDYEIPGIVLMENAGAGATKIIQAMLARRSELKSVLIVCGKGNNGGDGFVVARYLHNQGVQVHVVLIGKKTQLVSEAKINCNILQHLEIPFYEISNSQELNFIISDLPTKFLVIDSIFGTGLTGDIQEPFASIIQSLIELNMPVIALDIPSGLDANTGEILGVVLPAQMTITFGFAKQGFFRGQGTFYTGTVQVVDIGFPKELLHKIVHTKSVPPTTEQ